MTISLLSHFTEDPAPERKTGEIGKRPFSKWGEGIIGKHDLKPLLPPQGPSVLHRDDFVARQGPREIYGRNIFPYLGQEMIAHRWNLQWEYEWSGPTQAAKQRPLSQALFTYNECSPGSPGWLLFLFSSIAFTFSQRTAPLAVHLGLG